MTPSVAVIQFPGSNCERETVRACTNQGISAQIIRWNCSEEEFNSYSAYILPGGFSYQDRVRCGVIAANLPIIDYLRKADQANKLILGICNGCQILAETGLIPNAKGSDSREVALTPNQLNNEQIGHICDWIYVKATQPQANRFLAAFDTTTPLPIPVNHGMGRFIFADETVIKNYPTLVYCTSEGTIETDFPTNPNGTQSNIAGIGNQKGNVFAMMPHPERAVETKQIPSWIESNTTSTGPWAPLFAALKDLS
ncbi:phosphoribosylformylglycinamidine synthase I [bacterium]|jgi:phosphoribosylformylglycinamidine synthase subunit PurQ / glutaminase|nr:phosphoribosylformylglycinamidine synthase I [bacterium]